MANSLPESCLWPPSRLGRRPRPFDARACACPIPNPQSPMTFLTGSNPPRLTMRLRSAARRNSVLRFRTPTAAHGPGPDPCSNRPGQRSSRFFPAGRLLTPDLKKSPRLIPRPSVRRCARASKRPSCARFKRRWTAPRSRHRNKRAPATLSCANVSAPNEFAASGSCAFRRALTSGSNCAARENPAASRRPRKRPCASIRALDPGVVCRWLKRLAWRNGSRLAGSVVATLA